MVMSARAAVSGLFFLNGLMVGSWAPKLPVLMQRLDISEAVAGGIVLVLGLGSITIMPVFGALTARRGSARAVRLAALHECVAELDRLVPASLDSEDGFMRYMSANARLHALIVELAESPSLKRQIERAVSLPFASPNAFIKAQTLMPESRGVLIVAQDQHRCVAEAIANRQGARAQAIMQEHARLAGRHLRLALRDDKVLEQVPGGSLIRTGR